MQGFNRAGVIDVDSAPVDQPSQMGREGDTAELTGIVREARDRLSLVTDYEYEHRQRKRSERYFDGIDQWDPHGRAARERTINPETGERQSPKPTLTLDISDTIIQTQLAEARLAKFGLDIMSRASLRPSETTTYYHGQTQAILRDGQTMEALMWGFENALKFGDGAVRLDAEYVHDVIREAERELKPELMDQRLVVRRILDQETVYWDPYSEEADKSDAEWAIQSFWMSVKERRRRHPNAPIAAIDFGVENITEDPWYSLGAENEEDRAVRGAHYFRKARKPRRIVAWQGRIQYYDDVDEEGQRAADNNEIPNRVVENCYVEIFEIDGHGVLSQHKWPGRTIPLIPVVGKEYVVNGKHFTKGIITKLEDTLRIINTFASSMAELAAKAPRTPYVMAAGQDDGYEDEWDDLNTSPATRVHYNLVSLDGVHQAPPPQQQSNEPQIAGWIAGLQAYRDVGMQISGSVDPSTRASYPYDRSGRAIEALQRQGASGNAIYLDHFGNITMMSLGRAIVETIPHFYDRPGRILWIQGGDNTSEERPILLKQPFIYDQDNMPVPVPCPQCGGQGYLLWRNAYVECPTCEATGVAPKDVAPRDIGGRKVHYIDFSEGEFAVRVSIGRMHETAQKETLMHLENIAKAVGPEAAPLFLPEMFEMMPGASGREIGKRVRRSNPELYEEDERSPERLAAENQQLQQQIQEIGGLLEQYEKVISSKQIESQGRKELEAVKIKGQALLENLRQRGADKTQRTKGGQQLGLARFDSQMEQFMQRMEHRQEMALERLKQQHDLELERLKTAGKLAVERAKPDPAPRPAAA